MRTLGIWCLALACLAGAIALRVLLPDWDQTPTPTNATESWARPQRDPIDPGTFSARVVAVLAGDKLRLRRIEQPTNPDVDYQLTEIECPEHDQPFGPEAKAFTAPLP